MDKVDWKAVLRKAWEVAKIVIPIILGGIAGHQCGGAAAESAVKAHLVGKK